MRATFTLVILLSLSLSAFGDDTFPSFKAKVVDPDIGKVCYAVTLADVDGDAKQDIVAVSENRVLWYENPTWKPHVIIKDQTPRDNVCIAPMDIDGDGKIDFALGAGWTKIGTIHWLSRGTSTGDPFGRFIRSGKNVGYIACVGRMCSVKVARSLSSRR